MADLSQEVLDATKPSMSLIHQLRTWSSWLHASLYLDVGSSMTRVVYQRKLIWQQPTCVAIEKHSGTVISVGKKAFDILGKVPESMAVVFPVETGQPSNLEFLQKYLEGILQAITPQLQLPFLVNVKATITLPISTSPVESYQWRKVFRSAGFQSVAILPKPQALVTSISKTKVPQDYVCIIDIGAETTEVAAYAQGQLFKAETLRFGGKLYTAALETIVRSEYQGISSWVQLEKIKKQQRNLSYIPESKPTTHKTSLRVTDILSRNPKAIYIERAVIEAAFRTVSETLVSLVQDFLGELPTDVATALLERGVYLTGGGSLLAGLAEYLSYQLKLPYLVSDQPELDVIWGLTELQADKPATPRT